MKQIDRYRWREAKTTRNAAPRNESNRIASEKQTTLAPIEICVAFDEEASARSADILIKHVVSDLEYDSQTFRFDELDPPGPCVAAARSASAMDLLVIAVRDDRLLPPHVQSWLSLCLGLRDEDAEGVLVLLVSKAAEEPDPDSSLRDYLETVAALSGLAFPQRRNASESLGLLASWNDFRHKRAAADCHSLTVQRPISTRGDCDWD